MKNSHDSLVLQSDPRNVAQLETYLEGIVNELGVSPDQYGNILISLTEAVTNAIMHGNQRNSDKKVSVCCRRGETQLQFVVTDEGGGFDHTILPDPTAPENILKLSGRGVFLMKQLCDEINFRNNGSTVELQFKIC